MEVDYGNFEYKQLNKCETDPYLLQNFQCTTMFISMYCEICELNTERECVFAADASEVSLKDSCKFQVHKWDHNFYKTWK